MVNKKAYMKPECCTTQVLGSCLMISASGGNGVVNLTATDEEGDASAGLSRRNDFWDADE